MRRQKFLLPLPLSNLDYAKQLKLNKRISFRSSKVHVRIHMPVCK